MSAMYTSPQAHRLISVYPHTYHPPLCIRTSLRLLILSSCTTFVQDEECIPLFLLVPVSLFPCWIWLALCHLVHILTGMSALQAPQRSLNLRWGPLKVRRYPSPGAAPNAHTRCPTSPLRMARKALRHRQRLQD